MHRLRPSHSQAIVRLSGTLRQWEQPVIRPPATVNGQESAADTDVRKAQPICKGSTEVASISSGRAPASSAGHARRLSAEAETRPDLTDPS